MKLTIPLNHSQRYEEFPITRNKIFLAHAAASPLPRRVCAALQNYCKCNCQSGQWEYLYRDIEQEVRQQAAALMGATAEEIAFAPSTSAGLSIVACGLPWQVGDNVIVADGDFPANIYPWLNLRREGVEVKFVDKHQNGCVSTEQIMQLVDDRTMLVALSSVNYATGCRIDLVEIGKSLREKGVLFCVDAVQSLGAMPFNSEYVDFAAASAHKWLMGPMGIGILYVRKALFDRLRPALTGWKTVKDNKSYMNYNLQYPDSAQRYEPGSPNVLGIIGLHAALGILLEVGIDNIANRLAKLSAHIIDQVNRMGYEVISPEDAAKGSAIVSFTDNYNDVSTIRQYLDSNNFVVSLRDTMDNRKCIRVAPHFYNSEEEIAAFLDCLDSISISRKTIVLGAKDSDS